VTDAGFRKRFYWTAASIGAAEMAVVFAFIRGLIPPRFLGWILIGIAFAGFIAFYRLLNRARTERRASGEFDKPLDEATRRRYRSIIRRQKIWVALLTFWLIYVLWATRGSNLASRIIGPSVLILLIIYLIWLIRRLQQRLE